MVPRADVPRSKFKTQHSYKTTFNAATLIPVYVEEVLPGDMFSGRATFFCRMATPIFPIMDNLYFESFFFFVPNRLVWDNWQKFMGEQANPADSISYTIPQVTSLNTTGFEQFYLGDYFGLPVESTQTTATLSVNALPFRSYNRIYNEWFRDENLVNSIYDYTGDATQTEANYYPRRRAKRPDYFTSALPWPVKGGTQVSLPLGSSAPVRTSSTINTGWTQPLVWREVDGGVPAPTSAGSLGVAATSGNTVYSTATLGSLSGETLVPANLYADLSSATGATINAVRLAVASQQFLEKDARGGTRYAELLRNHFGVTPQDSRLQRPEYIGGGSSMFQTQAIPQTSASDITGSATPIGALGGTTVMSGSHQFSYSASEHGFILGIINVRADITYQQGIHRMFTRSTRWDYYWPTFAFLGEQAIRNDEIYATGGSTDDDAFGYQERWAEYRYRPSRITGMFRSYPTSGTLDTWHLSQAFSTLPALNQAFIEDYSNTTVERVVAAGASASGQQFLLDSVWNISATRALPARSVPGLTRF